MCQTVFDMLHMNQCVSGFSQRDELEAAARPEAFERLGQTPDGEHFTTKTEDPYHCACSSLSCIHSGGAALAIAYLCILHQSSYASPIGRLHCYLLSI